MPAKPVKNKGTVWKVIGEGLTDLTLLALAFLAFYHSYMNFTQFLLALADTDLLAEVKPWLTYSGDQLRQGNLPLWNPHAFSGYPHFAMPHAACLYPTTILYGLWSFPWTAKIDMFAHLFLMGAFGYCLGRDLFKNRFVAIVFAFHITIMPFFLFQMMMGLVYTCHAMTFAPLALLCLRRVIQGQSAWGLGLSAVIAMQIFSGDSQFVTYQLIGLGFYTAFELARRLIVVRDPIAAVLRRGSFALAGVVLGAGLGAIQLIPSYELLGESIRHSGITFNYLTAIKLRPAQCLALLQWIPGYAHAGPFTLAFAILAVTRRGQGERWAFLALGLFAMVYAFADATPFFSLVYKLPILNAARFPYRMLFFAGFSLFILAGYGLARCLDHADKRIKFSNPWSHFIALSALTLILPLTATFPVWRTIGLIAAATALFAAFIIVAKPSGRGVAVAVAALIAVQSIDFPSKAPPGDLMRYGNAGDYDLHPDYTAFAQAHPGLDRAAFFVPSQYEHLSLTPFAGMITGQRLFSGYGGLTLTRFTDVFDGASPIKICRWENGLLAWDNIAAIAQDWPRSENYYLLDMLNVRYLVAQDLELVTVEADSPGRFLKRQQGDLTVYENTAALPPAYVVHNTHTYGTTAEVIAALNDPAFDPRTTAILAGDPGITLGKGLGASDTVEMAAYRPEQIDIAADLQSPGILVLADTYYPGWQATANGQAVDVIPVNHLLQGIALEAGQHQVRFEYRPTSLRIGLWVSIMAGLIWLAWASVCYRRRVDERS